MSTKTISYAQGMKDLTLLDYVLNYSVYNESNNLIHKMLGNVELKDLSLDIIINLSIVNHKNYCTVTIEVEVYELKFNTSPNHIKNFTNQIVKPLLNQQEIELLFLEQVNQIIPVVYYWKKGM